MASNVNFPNHPSHPPSPDNGPTVIVVVFISFGCIIFFALCFFGLCCFIKNRKKKTVQETDLVRVDEHLKVKEAIVEGPHGPQAVVLSLEDDKHVEEQIIKSEKLEKDRVLAKSVEMNAIDVEAGESSSNPNV